MIKRYLILILILCLYTSCTSYLTVGKDKFTECNKEVNNEEYRCLTPDEISTKINNDEKTNDTKQINYPPYTPYPVFTENKPILKNAKYIKIWLAPYTDQDKNLHWPGYIYHLIQEKTWNYGIEDIHEETLNILPHQIDIKEEDE